MPTYWGETTPGVSQNSVINTLGNVNKVYTCDGSGSQTVKELSAYMEFSNVNSIMRVAVYSADRSTLICQGASSVLVVNNPATWIGHLTQADITPNPITLTGGVNYTLCLSIGVANSQVNYNSGGVSGAFDQKFSDYATAGFPASIVLNQFAETNLYNIRVGVDSATPLTGLAATDYRQFPKPLLRKPLTQGRLN